MILPSVFRTSAFSHSQDPLADLVGSGPAISLYPQEDPPRVFACPVAAGRETVVLMEHLRKGGRRLVADASRNPGDGVVVRFEHERGLVHSAGDQVTMHGLADEPRKASREAMSVVGRLRLIVR
jgi:hypothetical protein